MRGIRYLDLLGSFADQGIKGGTVAFDAWHPNAQGHDLIARALVRALKEVLPARAHSAGG